MRHEDQAAVAIPTHKLLERGEEFAPDPACLDTVSGPLSPAIGFPVARDGKPSMSVVFPAFNEELNLEAVVTSALRIVPQLTSSFEIIIVNDGSRDQTGMVAGRLAGLSEKVIVIHHPHNRGYGAALKSGFEQAKKDLVFLCDSDGQFNLEDLPRLLEWIDQYDMVFGYRARRQDPWHRLLNAKAWHLLVRFLLGLKVRDIDCAFKVFRREIFERIEIDTESQVVSTVLLTRALRSGFTLKEVPVRHFPRLYGEQTGARLRNILRSFQELAKIYWKIRPSRRDLSPGRNRWRFSLSVWMGAGGSSSSTRARRPRLPSRTSTSATPPKRLPGRVLTDAAHQVDRAPTDVTNSSAVVP